MASAKREPILGVRGRNPLDADDILLLVVNLNNKNCIILCIIYAVNYATIYVDCRNSVNSST